VSRAMALYTSFFPSRLVLTRLTAFTSVGETAAARRVPLVWRERVAFYTRGGTEREFRHGERVGDLLD